MFSYKLKRVSLIILFICLTIGFSIARYLSNEEIFIVDFVFLLFVVIINLYLIKQWNLANGLEKFMKSIVVILNIVVTISFLKIPQFLFVFQIALSLIIVKANEISFRMFFFSIVYQLVALIVGVIIDQYYNSNNGSKTYINICTVLLCFGV